MLQRQSAGPPALTSGSLRLSAWMLPTEYSDLYAVQYIGEPSVAIATSNTHSARRKQSYFGMPDSLLRLRQQGTNRLEIVERRDYNNPGLQPEQWLGEGSVLSMDARGFSSNHANPTQGTGAQLRALHDSPNSDEGYFNINETLDRQWWFTLLDSDHIAVLVTPEPKPGTAKLLIGTRDTAAEVSQEIPSAVSVGDAWLDGCSLAVIVEPDKLLVLNRATRQMEEIEAMSPVVVAALRADPNPACIYYSGGCLITLSSTVDKLTLRGLDGSSMDLTLLDPYYQNPDGSARRAAPGFLSQIATLFGSSAFGVSETTLRRNGRIAPLSFFTTAYGNVCLPFDEGRFVLFDPLYSRLVLIEYLPQQVIETQQSTS